jgi:16S rRNA (guanine1207-N2)-methyltransferase
VGPSAMANPDRLALAFETQALALPAAGTVLVMRAEPSRFLDLVPPDRLRCAQSFRPLHDALAEGGRTVAVEADGPAGMVIINLTRSRPENLGNIARGLDILPPGGTLVVTGAKSDGVDSLARLVAGVLPLDGAYTKAHGRVFWLTRPETLPAVIAAWADDAALRANADGFVTAPGMFSPERVDAGSLRLAATFDAKLSGRVADLGAGWGWLARTALEQGPGITEVDLYEAEALALDAARANVPDPRAQFHWADATALGAGVPPYDAVIANPPFHQGRAAEPDLGAAFIHAAARILKPGGRLLMVANRQLPYEATLAAAFRPCEKLSEDGTYKVLLAERPRRGGAQPSARAGASASRASSRS